MVQINFAQKSVTVKIVYYGPGMSGKTTNLEIVHQRAPDSSRGDLTSISTDGDRTLFFDFMPLDLGTVAGMRTQFQIYTVPGQVYYNSTRKLVLQGVDGVIFVADSSANMMEENLESLRNLEENLAEYGKDISEMPLIIQYNKRDLPDALPVAELEAKLNPWGCPSFEAVANSGQGVFPTLKALAARVLESIHDRTGAPTKPGPGSQAPAQAPAPPSAPAPMQAPSAETPQAAPTMQSAEQHHPSSSRSNAGQTPPAPFPTPNPGQSHSSSPFPAPAPQASTPPPPFPSPPQQAPAPVPASVNSASAEAASTPPNPFPAPSAPNMQAPQGGQGHHAPQHPAMQHQAPSHPEPQAPRTAAGPPTGGLTMGAPLPPQGLSLSQPHAPQAPHAAQPQGATGSFAPPHTPQAPGLGQTGIQPMYQPSSHSAPQGGPGATHPSLSQTGIRPMPGYGAPGAQAGQAGHPFPPVGAAPGAPGNPNAAPRPVPQSTRLKPRSQTVTITPADNKSGKGKWVFFTLLLLSAAGAGAAYFLELI